MKINTKTSGNDAVYNNYKNALSKGKSVQFMIGDDGIAHYGTPSWLEKNFGQSIISTNDYYDKLTQETNAFNVANQDKVMSFNANESQKNRDWQTMMSNTAHQREVADLMQAGINPNLYLGAGASTPSGGIGSATNVGYDSTMNSAKAQMKLQKESLQNQRDIANAQIQSQNDINKAQLANAKDIARLSAQVANGQLELDKAKLDEQIREFDENKTIIYDQMSNAKDISNISAGAMNYSANMGYQGILANNETAEKNAQLASQTTYDNSYVSVSGSMMNSLFGVDSFSVSASVSIPVWVLDKGADATKQWFKDTFGFEPDKAPKPDDVAKGAKDVVVKVTSPNPTRVEKKNKHKK